MAKCDLSWGDHYSSLLSVFGSYMKNDKLVDVTLAAEGKVIHVHRLVLLASSSYFEEMLSLYPEKQAVIFLKDVTIANLEFIVQYIYKGKVSVPHDQLISFMQTAHSLKIKGLLSAIDNGKQLVPETTINVDNTVHLEQQHMLAPSKEVVLPQQHVPVPFKQIVQPQVYTPPQSKEVVHPQEHRPAAPASSQEVVHTHPHTPAPSEGEVTDVSAQPEPVPSGSDTINYEEAEGSESNNETIELERSVANASCSHQMDVSDAELTAAVLDMSSTANGITLLENLLSSPVPQEKDNDTSEASGRMSWSPQDRFKGKSTSSMANSKTRSRSGVLQKPEQTARPFVCSKKECGKRFAEKWGLKQHLSYCGMPPQFQCPMCSSWFKRFDGLKRHANKIHGIPCLITQGQSNVTVPVDGNQDKEAEGNPVESPEHVIEYEVDEILERRLLPDKTDSTSPVDTDFEYLVSWEGCGAEENTWEPYANLTKCKKKMTTFLRSINTAAPASNSKRRSVRK